MESCANAPQQILLIDRLAKVANDAILQGAGPDGFIGVSRYEDCRNRVSRLDEAPVELEARHPGHMYIGDQTGRFGKARGCEEIGGGRESLDAVAQ
jgi:hypothetical protein